MNVRDDYGEDHSGSIVYPVVGALRSVSVYLKALRQGHEKKKSVRQLGKQLDRLHSINDDEGESYRAVLALLKEDPKPEKKPVKKPKTVTSKEANVAPGKPVLRVVE